MWSWLKRHEGITHEELVRELNKQMALLQKELLDRETRIAALETTVADHETRITALEGP